MNEVIYSVSELNLMIKSLLEGDRTFTNIQIQGEISNFKRYSCLLYTSPSPRDRSVSRMPSSA